MKIQGISFSFPNGFRFDSGLYLNFLSPDFDLCNNNTFRYVVTPTVVYNVFTIFEIDYIISIKSHYSAAFNLWSIL